MPGKKYHGSCLVLAFFTLLYGVCPVLGANLKSLPGHVPRVVNQLTAQGELPDTNQLELAIGLPMHDPAGLDALLADIYNPASPNYRHYLTGEEVTARFGPTPVEYEAVKTFARISGLTITATSSNRLILNVSGPASAIKKAFHINLRTYRHPTEARNFYAPDVEPTVDASLPVTDVEGLSDYWRPHPRIHRMPAKTVSAHRDGSAPDHTGAFFGDDLRRAYVPDSTLTGAGQSVGLFEADGYYANDIAAYAAAAGGGRTNIVIQIQLLDDYKGTPTTAGNSEVSLDIEQAMAVAPGLTSIISYEGNVNNYKPNDILNAMLANSSTVKNLSCSWAWTGGPTATTDNIFKSMQAVGQSFFDASGDTDAFTFGAKSTNGVDNVNDYNQPSDSPYITQVGGTTLTMNGSGDSYNSEIVWNWGTEFPNQGFDGMGSSGGVSSYYKIPNWQTNVTTLAAQGGSNTFRNIPDVAAIADNVYVIDGGYGDPVNGSEELGGTSASAPVWAGFTAMVNQQAVANSKPVVGFINPALYAIAAGSNYSACFHDVTSGNNTWAGSTNLFYATNGYDLCTGLGTPAGQNLIDALSDTGTAINTNIVAALAVSPTNGTAFGYAGGNFVSDTNAGFTGTFQLSNVGNTNITWSLINTSRWATLSASSGTLRTGAVVNLSVRYNSTTYKLPVGTFTTGLIFSNKTQHLTIPVTFSLTTTQQLIVSPAGGFTAFGPVGGPFTNTSQVFMFTNLSNRSVSWHIANKPTWLTASPAQGSVGGLGHAKVTISLATTIAKTQAAGIYSALLSITNFAGDAMDLAFTNEIGQPSSSVVSVIPNIVTPPPAGFSYTWNNIPAGTYQIQCSSNLVQPDWTDYGTPVSTTTGTVTLQDTNPITATPSRFYRIVPQ